MFGAFLRKIENIVETPRKRPTAMTLSKNCPRDFRLDSKDASIRPGDVGAVRRAADAGGGAGLGGRVGLRVGLDICSYAIVGTMAEVGVRRPTARALVLESAYHSQVRGLI